MGNFGVVSYLGGGILFLSLTILLASSWRGRLQGALLTVAALLNAVWCFIAASAIAFPEFPKISILYAELARDAAWFMLLLKLFTNGGGSAFRILKGVVYGVWSVALAYSILLNIVDRPSLPQGFSTALLIILLSLALVGLILIEQIYRNTRPDQFWAIKFLCIGLGGMFAYDLFLYSHALLFGILDNNLWNARGAVNALVVPLIALTAARNPNWSVQIFVSRHIVFHTVTLAASGLYLLAMASFGYYLRIYGGRWGFELEALFLFGAILVLMTIMMSGQLRARVKVFIAKHFYKNRYDYRLEWLGLIHMLTSGEDNLPLLERIIRSVAQIVESPGGALLLGRDENHFYPITLWNMSIPPGSKIDKSSQIATFSRSKRWVLDLDEVRNATHDGEDIKLPDWLKGLPQAWLVLPLLLEQELLGFIILTRSRAPHKLNWEDYDLLKTIASQISIHISEYDAARQLCELREFEAYNRLSAYIMHDLKNTIAQLDLIPKNAERHKDNPAFIEDAIRTVEHSVTRMKRLIGQLQHGQSSNVVSAFNLLELLHEVIKERSVDDPIPKLACENGDIEIIADRGRIETVISNIVKNAQQATDSNGIVKLTLRRHAEDALLEIRDNGCGMDEAFIRDRLYRPFQTTKGAEGMGIGVYEAREFIRQLNGDVVVESEPNKGTVFSVKLPVAKKTNESNQEHAVG